MPDQPYLYDPAHGSRNSIAYPYSDFNPRAATQAHYQAFAERAERQKRQSQQAGRPLINFNQHPDSYMVVNNPQVHHEPLPPSTKAKIVWTRWVQFALRVTQELGAIGILVCVICLKMKNNGPSWVIRIPVAWDMVVTTYAIYHLLRPAKGRTPNSSSSYHFFALFMDVGLIPFYVFIALYANQNYNMQVDDSSRWTSFFTTNFATTTVIFTTFVASIVVGGLHLVSIGLDIYLIMIFRKIASLPPDMNPLEDNLTGSTRRRSMKHKHKNSEMTVSSVSTNMSEKKAGYYSGSTLNVSRTSIAKDPEARVVPWEHSRMNSDHTYSPHNPDSARLSRQQFDEVTLHQGPHSARSSRVSISGGGHRSRAGTVVSPSERGAPLYFDDIPPVPAYTDRPRSTQETPERLLSAPSREVVQSQQKSSLLNDSWYISDGDASDLGRQRRSGHVRAEKRHTRTPTLPNTNLNEADCFGPSQVQPLKMNPPTPPDAVSELAATLAQEDKENHDPVEIGVARKLTVASQATVTSSVYSESAPSLMTSTMTSNGRPNNSTPGRKQYGDLASATRGIRNGADPNPTQPSRVVSRSGADIADTDVYRQNQQSARRREVSGKIAEEGRGGWIHSTTRLGGTSTASTATTSDPTDDDPPCYVPAKSKRYYASRRKSVKERRDQRNQGNDARGASYGETGPAWHLVLS